MRKTTPYFAGKLTLMHKTNVMEWLNEELRKAEKKEGKQDSETRPTRMYYQYKTLEEIERENEGEWGDIGIYFSW